MDLQTSRQFGNGFHAWTRIGAFMCFALAGFLMIASLTATPATRLGDNPGAIAHAN